jgi:hypothetical protein
MFAIECLLFCVKREHAHESESVVTLQNCTANLRDESGLFSGTCSTSSEDGNQFIFVKVEEASVEFEPEVKEDPWPSTSEIIQPEPAVSCVCPGNA